MCENAPIKVSVSNTVSLGFVINEENSNLTSLGHTDIFNDTGFHGNGIKMSKDGKVLAVGSRQLTPIPGQPTNRPGLHIYLKKSTAVGNKCCSGDENVWRHYQTIIFNDSEDLINADSVEISADGSSIVVQNNAVVYVFEELNKCSSNPRWVLQQTLENEDYPNIRWTAVQLDDDHKRLVIRVVDFTVPQPQVNTTFDVYDRQRLQKKCSNTSEDPDAFRFKFVQKVTPVVTEPNPLNVDTTLYALSHDGQTLVVVVRVQTADGISSRIVQYNFDCTDKIFKQVASVVANVTDSDFEGAQVAEIHFAGPCSEKLLVSIQFPDDRPYLIEVYSRLKSNTTCCARKTRGTKCCIKELKLFDENSLQAHFSDESPDTIYTVRIVSNPFDSESLLVFENVCVFGDNTLNIKLWKQCSTDPAVWCKNEILKEFDSVPCIDLDEFGHVSLDSTCGRYCYAVNRRTFAVPFGTFSDVYVNDPDGFFYLNASHGPTNEEIYFRVVGEKKYTLFDKSLPRQALKFCSTNFCECQLLEIVLVDGPAPVDFVINPDLIKEKRFIPIQTCFTTFCYQYNF